MAVLTAPLFAIQAHGSLAGTVSYYRHKRRNMAKKKPILPPARSWRQIYHQWLYQDACFYWHALSPAAQAAYNAAAKGTNTSGFNLCLRYYLNNLPDLALRFHSDLISGGLVIDSSLNGNNGTVFGALPTPALINQCLSYDGVDDYLDCGNDTSLNLSAAFTAEAVIWPASLGSYQPIIAKDGVDGGWDLRISEDHKLMMSMAAATQNSAGWKSTNTIDLIRPYHVAFSYDSVDGIFYIGGLPRTAEGTPAIGAADPTVSNLLVGRDNPDSNDFHGLLDEPCLYSRVLSPSQILAHAERVELFL